MVDNVGRRITGDRSFRRGAGRESEPLSARSFTFVRMDGFRIAGGGMLIISLSCETGVMALSSDAIVATLTELFEWACPFNKCRVDSPPLDF